MLRKLLFLTTILFALAAATSASASTPVRETHLSQDDVVITGECAFPVLAHVDGGETITTFVDADGDPVKQITTFPGNTMTLTNLDAGTSVTLIATGATQVRAVTEDSVAVKITGHGPFVPNPITGEPGIWYLIGQAQATFGLEGQVGTAEVKGHLIDLCARLA
jgi:hypothetical protein